jgi:tetratricopeptide (TPR) repeat protein
MKRLLHRQKMVLNFINSCDEILAGEPDNIEMMRQRGLLYTIAGEYDKAIQDFERTIEAYLADAKTYYLKSDCHYNKGEFDQAKRDYMRAVSLQYPAQFTEEDIKRAVILDDQDLNDIKTVVEQEKELAFVNFLRNFSAQ